MSTEARHPFKQQHLYHEFAFNFLVSATFDWHKYQDGAWGVLVGVPILLIY